MSVGYKLIPIKNATEKQFNHESGLNSLLLVTAAIIKTISEPMPAINANCGGTNIKPNTIPTVHIKSKAKNSTNTLFIKLLFEYSL